MLKYAILGYGVVGTGVAEVMAEQADRISAAAGAPLSLGYILVRHDYPGDPFAAKMVQDFSLIEKDPDVVVVAEVIGGVGAAYEYSKRAILAGKSVVSSNKELVAVHGRELAAMAAEKGVSYLFEGSVGGGIPLLRPLCQCLVANRIDEVFGIVNGTTNYILTAMETQGQNFDEALQKAQELGYAEADPTADVEGIDACRKTAILADLSFGYNVDVTKISTKGISAIVPADLELAGALGYRIKLLGRAVRTEDGCCAFVEPHLVPQKHLLASVSGVMNACAVRGTAVGEVLFYGPGAGRRPTASAVCSDIVDAVRHIGRASVTNLGLEGGVLAPAGDFVSRWYLRSGAALDVVSACFPSSKPILGSSQECGIITDPMDAHTMADLARAAAGRVMYRVLDS